MTSNFENQIKNAYLREFLPAIIGYGGVLATIVVIVDFDTAGSWKYAVALLPVIPALWGVVAVGRHVQRVDEYQRLVLLRGLAGGFGVGMITAITLGFLAMAGLEASKAIPWLIYSAGMLGWLVTAARISRG